MAKKYIKSILFITLPAIVFALVAGEIGLRLWWGIQPFNGPSAPDIAWFNKYVKANKMMLRGYLPPREKTSGIFRIVVLGDSITFGKGIEREADRYPEILVKRLSEHSGIKVDVVNLAFPALGTISEYSILKKHGLSFNPDVVILGYCYNDPITPEETARDFQQVRKSRWIEFLISNTYLASFAINIIYRKKITKLFAEVYHQRNAPDAPNIMEFRKALKGIVNTTREAGADFTAVIFPSLFGLDQNPYEFQDAHDLISGELKSLDVRYADILPLLKGSKNREYWASAFDPHPDERVHAMAAHELFPIVEAMIKKRMASGKASTSNE